MLEQAIERLTLEVVKLRDAVERQTLALERSPWPRLSSAGLCNSP